MLMGANFFAETTRLDQADVAFDSAIADLRVTGNVLLHETYASPWAIEIPEERVLRMALGLRDQIRVLPFHLVRRGSFILHHADAAPVAVDTHEVAICPGGVPHLMSCGEHAVPVALDAILKRRGNCATGIGAEGTELVCGVFLLRSGPLNPLLAALPSVLKIATSGSGTSPLLAHAAQMLALELASGEQGSFTSSRLLEIFCAEALKAHRHRDGGLRPGWFRALDDAKIGRALAQLHEKPGAAWTIPALAATVAMSPSRFAARFRETMGQSVMSYVASWRMNLACRMLRESRLDLTAIATEVGYQDVAAFSRAFKALVGESPARWRASQRQ